MSNKVKMKPSVSVDERKRRLARVYALLLSLQDIKEKETAGPGNFAENAGPAVEDAPTDKEDA
jgi:hypothetical protein